MAKWFGKIGYSTITETEPGIWENAIVEKEYYGDLISNRFRHQNSGNVNDDIVLSNTISILADQFVYQHYSQMVYVEVLGAKWKVTDVDASQRPRLMLTVGGVYNGEQA